MSDCGYQALFFFPFPKACIIDDSSFKGKFLSTEFILIVFFAY